MKLNLSLYGIVLFAFLSACASKSNEVTKVEKEKTFQEQIFDVIEQIDTVEQAWDEGVRMERSVAAPGVDNQ